MAIGGWERVQWVPNQPQQPTSRDQRNRESRALARGSRLSGRDVGQPARHDPLTRVILMRHAERSGWQTVGDVVMVVVEVGFLCVVAGGFMLACILFALGSL